MNRIDRLFSEKKQDILNIYFTAGFPRLDDTLPLLGRLQECGADMAEVGIPFSDSLADGPVIQQSNEQALKNGMSQKLLFSQLGGMREKIDIPVILMGSLNPVMQYGITEFLQSCRDTGVDGVILPDLPVAEYEAGYAELFEQYGIYMVFLVTPETTEKRLRQIDGVSRGFIYAVSSSSTTGSQKNLQGQQDYFRRLQEAGLKNPVLVGFGIRDHDTFQAACAHTRGAVIGTAFIRAIAEAADVREAAGQFIAEVRG
jgi:tryptophan synthase alpha chain